MREYEICSWEGYDGHLSVFSTSAMTDFTASFLVLLQTLTRYVIQVFMALLRSQEEEENDIY